MPKVLIWLAYGREWGLREVIFSVLSFFASFSAPRSQLRVILFTDRPDYLGPYLDGLDIRYEVLDTKLIEEMMAGIGDPFRVKLAVIQTAAQMYPGSDLVFCDGDTFFRKDGLAWFEHFQPGRAFMHLREYPLAEFDKLSRIKFPQDFAFYEQIKRRAFTTSRGQERFHGGQDCWNSGVVALHTSAQTHLADVFSLHADFYLGSGCRNCEQLALSLVLQTRGQLLPACEYVYHYWPSAKRQMFDHLFRRQLFSRLKSRSLSARLVLVSEFLIGLEDRLAENVFVERQRVLGQLDLGKGAQLSIVLSALRLALRWPPRRGYLKDLLARLRALKCKGP